MDERIRDVLKRVRVRAEMHEQQAAIFRELEGLLSEPDSPPIPEESPRDRPETLTAP